MVLCCCLLGLNIDKSIMKYYKHPYGQVFAYETKADRDKFGAAELVEMSAAEIDSHINPPVVAPVPSIVTMRQARLALLEAGQLAAVETAINALPEPQRSAARIEWDYSSEVHRDRAFVQTLGAALGLDSDALDALFTQAATL